MFKKAKEASIKLATNLMSNLSSTNQKELKKETKDANFVKMKTAIAHKKQGVKTYSKESVQAELTSYGEHLTETKAIQKESTIEKLLEQHKEGLVQSMYQAAPNLYGSLEETEAIFSNSGSKQKERMLNDYMEELSSEPKIEKKGKVFENEALFNEHQNDIINDLYQATGSYRDVTREQIAQEVLAKGSKEKEMLLQNRLAYLEEEKAKTQEMPQVGHEEQSLRTFKESQQTFSPAYLSSLNNASQDVEYLRKQQKAREFQKFQEKRSELEGYDSLNNYHL